VRPRQRCRWECSFEVRTPHSPPPPAPIRPGQRRLGSPSDRAIPGPVHRRIRGSVQVIVRALTVDDNGLPAWSSLSNALNQPLRLSSRARRRAATTTTRRNAALGLCNCRVSTSKSTVTVAARSNKAATCAREGGVATKLRCPLRCKV